MAFFRGQDGSLTISGTAVGQLQNWTVSTQLEELDTSSMGDAWKSVVGGMGSWSGNATAKIDLASASQSTLAALIFGATPTSTTVAAVFRVSASKTFSGNVLLKDVQVQSQLGQIVTITFGFTGSGSLTFAWS